MDEMLSFNLSILEAIPAFLSTPPINYIVGFILMSFVVSWFFKFLSF